MKQLLRALILILPCVLAVLTVGHSQTLPGTSQDRVGYPVGYRDNYSLLYVLDRPDTKRVLVTYGNDQATSVQRGGQGKFLSVFSRTNPGLRPGMGHNASPLGRNA